MTAPVSTQTALLQVLLETPGYGLELIERVRRASGGVVELVDGAVYPALRGLEAEGLLESWERPPAPDRGGRPRRYYQITPAGALRARAQRIGLAGLLGVTITTPSAEPT